MFPGDKYTTPLQAVKYFAILVPGACRHSEMRPWRVGLVIIIQDLQKSGRTIFVLRRGQTVQCRNTIMLRQTFSGGTKYLAIVKFKTIMEILKLEVLCSKNI